MSSDHSAESTRPNKSNSAESSYPGFDPISLIIYFILSVFIYCKGRKHGAENLTAQLPDCEIFNEREALRQRQEKLKSKENQMVFLWPYNRWELPDLRELAKELVENVETLDRKELEHLQQRANELKSRLETQNVSVETVNAQELTRKAVNAGILPDKTYAISVPHEGDSMIRAKPNTETKGPLITKPGPGPEFNLVRRDGPDQAGERSPEES